MKTLEMYHIIFPFTRHLALIIKGGVQWLNGKH